LPGGSAHPRYSEAYQWRTGGETVVIPQRDLSAAYARTIETAMRTTSPGASLVANEALLWKIRVLGGRYELADVAGRLAPEGVLIDRGNLRLIQGLAREHKPMVGSRVLYISDIPYVNARPDYNHAVFHWSRDVAIPADGVRAIAAMMAVAGLRGRWSDCCEVFYTPPVDGTYAVWTISISGAPVKKYLVDAQTLRVSL
jgi:hypothetical protein